MARKQAERVLSLSDILFAGFNRRVAAMDKHTGTIIWSWVAPKGQGFVSLVVEGDRVFAGVHGHIYCLDAVTGEQLWHNPTEGFGYGVTCLATVDAHSNHGLLAEAHAQAQRQQAAAAGGAGA